MLSTLMCDHIPKGFPAQYIHKKGTEPINLVSKSLRFNDPIIMVQKKNNPEINSTYDKVHVSFQSTYLCNIQYDNMLSKFSMFYQ